MTESRETDTKMNMEKRRMTKKDKRDMETESIQNGKRKEVKIQCAIFTGLGFPYDVSIFIF